MSDPRQYLITLIDEAITVTTGDTVKPDFIGERCFQAFLDASGSAVVRVECSLDGTHWLTMATLNLDPDDQTLGFTSTAPWLYIRGVVDSITEGNTVTLLLASDGAYPSVSA